MNRFQAIKYTIKHKIAFIKLEKKLLGKNSIRGYLHDGEKILLYLILGKSISHKIHRSISRHHLKNIKTRDDKIQMLIDWESARFTKPDKPLTARQYMYKACPELADELLPLMKELGI